MTEKVLPIFVKKNPVKVSDERPLKNVKSTRERLPAQGAPGAAGYRLLRKIALTSPDPLFILEVKKNKLEFISIPENLKKAETDFFPERILSGDKEKLWKELTNKTASEEEGFGELEVRISGKKGDLRLYHLRYSSFNDDKKGVVTGWFCQARDITESREGLKETRDSKLKPRMALNGSGMGVWSYNPYLRKIECDSRCCSILGLTGQELNGNVKNIFSRIYPEDRRHFMVAAFNALKQKGRFNLHFRLSIPGSSEVKPVIVLGGKMINEQTGETVITGTCLDANLPGLSQNRLYTNEAFLEESQRIAKIGCFDWDLVQDTVQLTPQVNNLLGIRAHSPLRLSGIYNRIHPQDLPAVKKALRETIKNGSRFSKEFRFMWSDNKPSVLWVQGQVSRNGENRTTRLTGTIQDISGQNENLKELNTQNLIIRSILYNLPVIIRIIDRNGVVKKLLGEAGLKRIGMKENQEAGECVFDQESEIGKHIHQVLEGKTVNFTENIIFNGRIFHFLNYYFYDPVRELAIGFSLDISAQKNTEAAFQQVSEKNRELERINKVLDLFVYAAAHDLKNPINNLEMISGLMKGAGSVREQEEYQNALIKSIKRLKQTIFGLMEIVEVESSKELYGTKLRFQDILNQVKEDLEQSLIEKEGRINVNFKEKTIFYNIAFLTSIMKNLLSNAIKYADEKRKPDITFRTESKNGYLLLSVSDNGIGIDLPLYQPNLFKPFKRFTSQAGGTGVGLHLIKNMVEKNGGYIEIESTPGKGTCFSCYLVPFES